MGATLFEAPGLKSGIQMFGLVSVLIVLFVAVAGITPLRHGGSRPGPSDPNPGDGWGKGAPPPDSPRPDGPRAAFRSTMRRRRACVCAAGPGWRRSCRRERGDPRASLTERRCATSVG
jgi:hypothetical protein